MADAQKILGLGYQSSGSRQGGTKARPENITNMTQGLKLKAYLRIRTMNGSCCDIVIKLYSGNSAATTFWQHCNQKLYKDTWIYCQTDTTKWQGGGNNRSQVFLVHTTGGGSVWDTARMRFGDVLSGLEALTTSVGSVFIADCDIIHD